ncbi:DUF2252 domain-containing protein [Angustibacter sp. McL0619]|uniref:DUF2252 domain-containing protein n=1 Tax=Angustibacter sp. McL0619 TaxID=3415676 RepID=UPI003CF73656
MTTAPVRPSQLTREERAALGKSARAAAPLESHAEHLTDGRPDPVDLLESQATSRVTELVPIRYGRMLASPFAFYRGGALIMASDLSRTPRSGLTVQLCGDAHLSNFGIYATPERRLFFDINDFDETHPGPFEWDVKRLVASLAVASRSNGFSGKQRRKVLLAAGAAYRTAMKELAGQRNLEVWYTHLDMDDAALQIQKQFGAEDSARARAAIDKARRRNSLQALGKLTTMVDGKARIRSDPPLLVPVEELWGADVAEDVYRELGRVLESYGTTLQSDRRHLLAQFELVQIARKVVGVGSVGTRAFVLLMQGIDGQDPLFLQAKQAQESVLAPYTGGSADDHHGRRVVTGQHLMQASSDIFLGWQRVPGIDGVDRDYYLRQLRDGKGSVIVENLTPTTMKFYGEVCARTLARAHARSGDRVAIAAYLGSKTRFDEAIADHAHAYADQNERDHAALGDAVATGRVTARSDL